MLFASTINFTFLDQLTKIFSFLNFRSYGYVTNSKIKFIIVVDSSNTALRENDVRTVSQKVQATTTTNDSNQLLKIGFSFVYLFFWSRCFAIYIRCTQMLCVIHFMCPANHCSLSTCHFHTNTKYALINIRNERLCFQLKRERKIHKCISMQVKFFADFFYNFTSCFVWKAIQIMCFVSASLNQICNGPFDFAKAKHERAFVSNIFHCFLFSETAIWL